VANLTAAQSKRAGHIIVPGPITTQLFRTYGNAIVV
jgi:hypothetical protein